MKRLVYLAAAALVAVLLLAPAAFAQGSTMSSGTMSSAASSSAMSSVSGTGQKGGKLAESGGPAIILPAAALLLGSGILTFAVLRRRQ